jgi:hypothetical protein
MLRISMLKWVRFACLVIAISAGGTSWGQTKLNPRTCVVAEKVTNECPEIDETQCPIGPCVRQFAEQIGCLSYSEEGIRIIYGEALQLNPGGTVQAARQANAGEVGRMPIRPILGLVCYENAPCGCVQVVPGYSSCRRGTFSQYAIYSWKPSNGAGDCIGTGFGSSGWDSEAIGWDSEVIPLENK